jgi:soluble calcium-activated nucleotidase 1
MRMASWRLYLRRHPQTVALIVMFVVLFTMVTTFLSNSSNSNGNASHFSNTAASAASTLQKYAYQQTYQKYDYRTLRYNFSVISDKDENSKNGDSWHSILKSGELSRDNLGYYSVSWLSEIQIESGINNDGRGMELSDLTYFNNQLLTCDDRIGIVYEVDAEKSQVIARHILVDGDGRSKKGFKCEWTTVKDGLLYVGGLGKEWTKPDGTPISRDPQYVKTIDEYGHVEHVSWVHVYEALRKATLTTSPGYLIHEAVRFNPSDRRWYFLPRRASKEMYNDREDQRRGANMVIHTNEFFEDIKYSYVGDLIPTHGFSAFAFVPFRENEIIALKTEEVDGTIATYITMFDLSDGTELLPESKIGDVKFEGIEFL